MIQLDKLMKSNNSDLIILAEETTDVNYGWDYNNRPIDKLIKYGILYVDKPQGPTSHEVVAWVRKILQINKAGHSGTLDPLVTGILPIGLEESTKVLSVLLLGSKEYHGVGRLHGSINSEKLNLIVKEFTGEIYQKPPQKSAVKKVTRTRQIYDFQILEVKDNLFLFKVICESGTYIRKLIYDMGEILGVGATMAELRRSQVCHISESDFLLRIHDLVDAVYLWKNDDDESKLRKLIQPVESALSELKKLVIRDSAIDSICHGAQLAIPGILQLSNNILKNDPIAVYSLKGELVSIGTAQLSSKEITDLDKGIAILTDRVIMNVGTYPKMWKNSDTKNNA